MPFKLCVKESAIWNIIVVSRIYCKELNKHVTYIIWQGVVTFLTTVKLSPELLINRRRYMSRGQATDTLFSPSRKT